jgi:hypothetical protein
MALAGWSQVLYPVFEMGDGLMRFMGVEALAGCALLLLACSATPLAARAPDSFHLPSDSSPLRNRVLPGVRALAQQTPAPTPAEPPAAAEPEPPLDDSLPDLTGEQPPPEDFSVGEIPAVETVELTADIARKAIDAYVQVREKFKDAALENYENLQDFVDQDSRGKEFEADIKTFGFKTVNDWNIAVTTVGFAYANLLDDQTEDIKLQIEEVKADTEMAQDMRNRMVQALSAMIPSDNNRRIVEELMKDAAYAEKLKLLETEEE